ncbi:MAG: sigma-70 family RNA polymerase sigma factor [Acidimicrobiia bacterium]|nr:sigma-70 family RNA polymerase sigma factor [Acidimicrobiia bacterium]
MPPAESLLWAWEHWHEVRDMVNAAGYLDRVGQSKARSRKQGRLPATDEIQLPDVEPGLIPALRALPPQQRTAVWLVQGCGWSHAECAEAMDIAASTVATHVERALETSARDWRHTMSASMTSSGATRRGWPRRSNRSKQPRSSRVVGSTRSRLRSKRTITHSVHRAITVARWRQWRGPSSFSGRRRVVVLRQRRQHQHPRRDPRKPVPPPPSMTRPTATGRGGTTSTRAPLRPARPRQSRGPATQLIVLGGERHHDGAAYDPASEQWRMLPDPPLPEGVVLTHWTGDELIAIADRWSNSTRRPAVVHGTGGSGLRPRHRPVAATRRRAEADAANLEGLVWTGTELVLLDALAAYDPDTDQWRDLDLPPERLGGGSLRGRLDRRTTRSHCTAHRPSCTTPKPARPNSSPNHPGATSHGSGQPPRPCLSTAAMSMPTTPTV